MSESALLSGATLRRRFEPVATVREVRVAAALTHEQLAIAAGVPLRTVRNVEQARYSPRLPTRAKLAKALGVAPSTIRWPSHAPEPPTAA
jgi:DNA-binding XRE family transcriptional regulator